MEKTYGEIIPLHKSDVIFGDRMGSLVFRDKIGTKQQEILMGKTEYNEVEGENNKKHDQRYNPPGRILACIRHVPHPTDHLICGKYQGLPWSRLDLRQYHLA